jgi:hypothetical protein
MGVTLARPLPPARETAGRRELRLLTDLNPLLGPHREQRRLLDRAAQRGVVSR